MSAPHALFEVSWEVCQRIGGIHTLLSSGARARVARHGDGYVLVGPWRLAEPPKGFQDDPTEAAFAEALRAAGLPVRVGHWQVPGRPRTLLVEFSGLIAGKDALLGSLWDRHQVDSLAGSWEYVEAVLFGHAAGRVIERWWLERGLAVHRQAVVQAHEWSAASALLHLSRALPSLGTVFQVHSTVLGNALAAAGRTPSEGLDDRTPEQWAERLAVRAQHSLEGVTAQAADVFTTVSATAADEGVLFHGRRPEPLLPNVLDVESLAAHGGRIGRAQARVRVRSVLSRVLGEDLAGARLLFTAGRPDMRVKGFDLLIDALAVLDRRPGARVVALFVVPWSAAGVRPDVAERLAGGALAAGEVPALATHVLFEPEADPLQRRALERGLGNHGPGRVRLLHVPVYLEGRDGVFDLPYASVLEAADLTCFPSAYESWGLTPQESLALGVPTITTDLAGFGRFLLTHRLDQGHGATVLARRGRTHEEAVTALADALEAGLAAGDPDERVRERCRAASHGVVEAESERARALAYGKALELAQARSQGLPAPRPAGLRPVMPAPQRVTPHLHALEVPSRLPAALAPLAVLAQNWRWAWHAPTRALFEDLDPERAVALRGNALRLVREAPQGRLDALAADPAYVARVQRAAQEHSAWLAEAPSLGSADGVPADRPVAYICAEYALHECAPLYSGGLGVLAGDHLRAASDLGLPLVAVGLLYRRGYFRQRLEGGVEQVAEPEPLDPALLPLERVLDAGGGPLEVELPLPGATLRLQAWKAAVGRVALYLLDADHPGNRPEDRGLTHALYAGDAELRLKQELILGRGGVRLLDRMGLKPSVLHVNEGHGAFAGLERIALLVREAGLTFDEALQFVRQTTLFTTHTPVPAGHDRFDEDLLRRYLSDAPTWLGIPWERFLGLGAIPERPREFNVTFLAANLAGFVNGVSQRHAQVSRPLLRALAPHLLTREVPVAGVTNGVHLPTWTAPEVATLLGASAAGVTGADFERARDVDLVGLAEARRALKQRLLERVRRQLEAEMSERGDPAWLSQQVLQGLTSKALWIGFARRFATYKRAGLLLSDPDRLRALLESSQRPVRIVLAGKAHPRDKEGSELVGRMARLARSRVFAGRIFFLQGYDLALARLLVQGVDLWLNTPRPPYEACGTSGMKAAANGGLNLSTADGWWLEGFDGTNGWTIGDDRDEPNEVARDRADAEALYRLLEDEVLPLWNERDERGLARKWLERSRRALSGLPPQFDAVRMVAEYRDRAYAPRAQRRLELEAEGHARLKAFAAERRRVREGFAEAAIVQLRVGDPSCLRVGDALEVEAQVRLGRLAREDVLVELLLGRRDGERNDLTDATVVRLAPVGREQDGIQRFTGRHLLESAGSLAYGVRMRPRWEQAGTCALHEPGLWA